MKPGDVCEIEIEGLGVLRNPIVHEGEDAVLAAA
jgi:2-keto-4-pentenoate hydratase/2-oxohepta-3-ene-1,7-dioic acid hydratase in catechol pathway